MDEPNTCLQCGNRLAPELSLFCYGCMGDVSNLVEVVEVCPHCKLSTCDCPNFDLEGNEL